jgi:hypothetical protein
MCDRFFARTICLFLLIGPYFSQAGQHPGEFAASITSHVQMQYLLFTPEGYEQVYKHPEKFAAIAPMSAPMVITAWASRLKEMPIWVFHGEKDELVPVPTSKIWFMRSRLWGMTSG